MHAARPPTLRMAEPQRSGRGTIYPKLMKRKAFDLNFGKYRLDD
jgi:hypothetical protein